MKELTRGAVKELVPYDPKEPSGGIKLDANENTYPMPKELKDHMLEWVSNTEMNRYPNTNSDSLKEVIGERYGVNPLQIICTVGSDQLIDCLFQTFVEAGEAVVVPDPSFVMYSLVGKMHEANLIKVNLDEAFKYNELAYLEAIDKYQPKLTFICNPNNPTGSMMASQSIERIAKATTGLLVIDEAYIEFGGESAIDLVEKYSNIVILRTFSKAYGLAGARVGYGIGSERVIQEIYKVKPPYNLNQYSQEMARWVMANSQQYTPSIDSIIENRELLKSELKKLGYTVYPSNANFLWVATDRNLREELMKEDIYIRQIEYKDKPYYRISIGTEEENNRLIMALKKGGSV